MKYPFKIETTFNNNMKCYEIMLQVGGINNKEELDLFSENLAKFMANGTEYKRVKHDA